MILNLTGLAGRDWLVIGMLATAIVLALRSLWPPTGDGRRWHPLPLAASVLVTAILLVSGLLSVPVLRRAVGGPVAIAAMVALSVVAFALVDFLFSRIVPIIRASLARLGLGAGLSRHGALAIALVPIVAGSAVVAARLTIDRTPANVQASVGQLERFDLPGDATGLEMVSPTTGYVTVSSGAILRVDLPAAGGALRQTSLVDGLEFPRGIAVLGSRLYVGELVGLPCDPPFPLCEGPAVGPTAAEGERTIIRAARGRISSYAIDASGGLSDRAVLLDDLPVGGSQHAVNGLAVGADGMLYVSVGHQDFNRYEVIGTELTPHPEWFGTILRVDAEASQVDVFARGLRNVYGLTFDGEGALWGVDNDGPARSGWRLEELLLIKEDRSYGFPDDGTFGPWINRDDGPVWTLNNTGSAGILWAGEADMPAGVFIGDCGTLKHLELFEVEDRWSTKNPATEGQTLTTLLELQGCVTDLAALGPRTILASVFNYDGGGELLRITLEE